MRFENHFDVDAPIDTVWEAVLDVERVAPAVPGATVLRRVDDDAFDVSIKVKVGPISMTYRGELEVTERDPAAHRAVMTAKATESRGQGAVNAVVTIALAGGQTQTSASVTTDVQLRGKVASMGQAVLQEVSGRLIDTFAANLAGMLRADEVRADDRRPSEASHPRAHEEAFDVGGVGTTMLMDRLRKARPALVPLAAAALIAFLLRRRSRG
jgi:uncharacterized protein